MAFEQCARGLRVTTFSAWLHALPAAHVALLRQFRAQAAQAYPEAANPVAEALKADGVPQVISAMPREFVERIWKGR